MLRYLIVAGLFSPLLPFGWGRFGLIVAAIIWLWLGLYLLAATWDLLGGSILTPRDSR